MTASAGASTSKTSSEGAGSSGGGSDKGEGGGGSSGSASHASSGGGGAGGTSSASGTASASAPDSSSSSSSTSSGDGDQSALTAMGISTFLGNNTGGIASWYNTDASSDSTNGRSWCEFPYDNTVPGFAPSLKTMLASFNQDSAAAKTGFCGLEAQVYSPKTGTTTTLIIADAFDDTWVLTPASIDVIKGSFAAVFGSDTDNKQDVAKDVSWVLTGNRNDNPTRPTLALSQAIRVTPAYVRQGNPADPSHRAPPSHVYDVCVSHLWTIGSVAHGGYLLACLTKAVKTHQRLAASPHLDPAHLSSQFLSATAPGKAQIEVKEMRVTKRWTRLDVELWQWTPDPNTKDFVKPENERVLRIQAHYLVTSLPPHPSSTETPTQGTNDYLARPCPLLKHPGEVDMRDGGSRVPSKMTFRDGMRWKEVESIKVNDGSLSWAAWIELTGGEDVRRSAALLPFFADVSQNGPEMAPEDRQASPSYRSLTSDRWYPTMTFSLDFKSAFPLPSSSAERTFGLFASTKSIHDGRHDLTVEVWSAPADLGEGVKDGGEKEKDGEGVERWRREGSRLLGVSTQMALSVPLDVNHARAAKSDDKKARL
ncbi:hypothetical protein JCM11641_005721 [Rhodosporidiobolus odoratus]